MGYFDVKEDKVDPKLITQEMDLMSKQIQLARNAIREGYGNKAVKAALWVGPSSVSGSNAAITTASALTITDSTEWAAWSSLFDLVRTSHFDIHTTCQIAFTTAAAEFVWACSFDPSDSTALTSQLVVLPAVYKVGPVKVSPVANAGTAITSISPQSFTENGFINWKARNPPPTELPNQAANNNNYAGDWVDMATATIVVGYLKPYVPAGGSGAIGAIVHYVECHCEFKFRA